MANFTHRRAFTLVELLVVIAIIALVVTLVMPLIYTRRDGHHAKGYCRMNMKQLMLSMQNYHDAKRTFPPLYLTGDPALKANHQFNPTYAAEYYSWQTAILPYIEEDKLFKSIMANSATGTLPSTKVTVPDKSGKRISPANMNLTQFLCTTNPLDEQPGMSNYVALSSTRLPLLLHETTGKDGLPAYQQEPDGLLIPNRTQRGYQGDQIADGLSKTAVLIESLETARSNWYKPQESFVVGFLPADSMPIDWSESDYYPYFAAKPGTSPDSKDWRFNPAAGNRTALAGYIDSSSPKIPYHSVKGDPLERTWGPSSAHDKGVIFVGMGDGSVREITLEIDPVIFFSAITVRGGEAVQPLEQLP